MNKIWIAVIFGGLTLASAAVWYVTGSDFWGGIFGNMLVGAVTLLFIDYLLDASMERQRKPARKAAIRAASEVHGQAIRLIFNLYGASVLTGRLSLLTRCLMRSTSFGGTTSPEICPRNSNRLSRGRSTWPTMPTS